MTVWDRSIPFQKCANIFHIHKQINIYISLSLSLCVRASMYCMCVFCLQIFATIIASVEACFIHITQFANRFEQSMWQKRAARRMCVHIPVHRRTNTHYTHALRFTVLHLKNFSKFVRLEHIRASHYVCYGWKSGAHESPDHSNRKCITQRQKRNFAMAENGITTTVWMSYINRWCHLFSPCVGAVIPPFTIQIIVLYHVKWHSFDSCI